MNTLKIHYKMPYFENGHTKKYLSKMKYSTK